MMKENLETLDPLMIDPLLIRTENIKEESPAEGDCKSRNGKGLITVQEIHNKQKIYS